MTCATFRIVVLPLVVLLMIFPQTGEAQTSYPMLMSLDPVAVQLGQVSEHELESRYSMFDFDQVLVTGSGVTGEIITPMERDKDGKAPSLTKLKLRLTVTPDATEGIRDFRIIGPTGASTLGQLVVTRLPVVAETNKNDTLEQATPVTVPATVCGTIEAAEDVDFFKFHLDQPTRLTFHMLSMRLQDKIHDLQTHADPILTIRNSSGSTVVAADNVYAADPFLNYHFETPGDYYIEVRDVRYQGNRYWKYAIEVSDQAYVKTLQPLAVQLGTETPFKLIGSQLGETDIFSWQPGEQLSLGQHEVQLPLPAGRSNPVQLYVSDVPVFGEQLRLDSNTPTEQILSIPGGIAGQVEQKSDIDSFRFTATKGERLTFEVFARRLNSELDPILWITNSEGRSLIENDDMRLWGKRTYQDSLIENWTVPADGDYLVNLRDVHLRGGEQSTYFLKATYSTPEFELVLDSDKTLLAPGTCGAIFARAVRKNGFVGEIALSIENLPAGVTAHPGRILANGNDGCIILQASAEAGRIAQNIRVVGRAVLEPSEDSEPRELVVVGQSMQETYMPGGGRNHWPVEMHTVAVGTPGDIRAVTLAQSEVSLKPGESIQIGVSIERGEGFVSNVTLDMLFQHLSSKFADNLPKGVTVDGKKSKTLLTGKESTGHITLTAAKDAPPVEKQLCSVMANVSLNFVMKATYSSPPIYISVSEGEGK